MKNEFEAAEKRMMDETPVRLIGRQEKSSQGAGGRVTEMPLYKVRAAVRAQPALAVYGD